ncbi:MAG: Jag N-terminal domain-containing protein [Candidatus Omnitrophota bacterium]
MKSIEVEASTREEAIKIALATLGAQRKDVVIKILREEKSGLFGRRGQKLAKVRVSLKENPAISKINVHKNEKNI